MAEMILVNKKVIHDPMYTPVRQWLTRRIEQLTIDGDPEELALAKARYESLVAGDLVIEDVKTFTDGIQRVCIVSRKTGFARADIEFTRVPMQDILDDFAIPFVNIEDTDALKEFSKTNEEPAVLLWLEYKQTYGVLLTQASATTIDGAESAFGELFFQSYRTDREDLGWIDYDTLESGTVTITDPSIGAVVYPLFIQELVLNEANLPIITSNLPEFITAQRGGTIDIPNTYWFGGTLDITETATVEITTAAGYTVPKRSTDKLSIEGPVIYGSSTQPVTDQIIVRVTHQYNGRPVRRTFRIEVRIAQDTAFDLVISVVPPTIKAARGDDVLVVAYASFKGTAVTLGAAPAKFESPKGYGDLLFTGFQPDGGMVYEGRITGVPPMGLEVDKDLYTADFSYDDGSTPYHAPGFINFELVRADSKPVFRIASLTTTLRGKLDDVKQMEVKAFYGDTPVPAYELGIQPGPRGDNYQLIRVDSATAEAVNYTVIRDSNQPGEDIEDEFEQKFTYTDEFGVRHSLFRDIKIVISKASIVEIIPVNVPREVTRYQKGGPLFKVMVNGVDKTHEAIGLNMIWASEFDKYLAWENGQWLIKFSDDTVKEVPVKFTWKQPYDSANHDLEFEGEFKIKIWDPNTNPGGDGNGENPGGGDGDQGGDGNNDDGEVNTEVVVFPMYWGISGLSDERGTVSFRVYSDGVEITKTARRDIARTVMPPELRDEGVRYDEASGMLVWTYYKLAECDAKEAKLFYTDPKDGDQTNLPANRRGRMYITVNVKQSRILKVVEQDTSEVLMLDGQMTAKLKLSFAGEPISLLDLNRTTIAPAQGIKQATLLDVQPEGMTFTYTTLQGPNSTHSAPMQYEFSYTDPVTGELQKLEVTLNIIIKIQPLEITQADGGVINCRMWDAGPLIFKAMIGIHDVTSLMTYNPDGLPTNRYVGLGGRNWSIINADRTDHSESINVRMRYTINVDYTQLTAYVPKTWNIEAWDGIEFRHTLSPLDIVGDSGGSGEIRGTFQWRFDDVTNGIRLDRGRSTIPDNIEFDNPIYDVVTGETVIKYRLKRGYKYPFKLVFLHPTRTDSIVVDGTSDVTWAPGLNLESKATDISGYFEDVIDFPFKYNFSGTPLTNDQLSIMYATLPAASTTLVETLDDKLRISLDMEGGMPSVQNAQITLDVTYTNPDDSQVYTDQLIVPTEIKIPDVTIGANPVMTAKVYDRGEFRVTLVDSRGKNVPITDWSIDGTNNYVQFVPEKSYYVVKGDTAQTTLTDMKLGLKFNMGGSEHDIYPVVQFQITKFDGIDFTAKALQDSLTGKAGEAGVADFVFTYKGDVTHAVRLLDSQSTIPANLLVGELTNSQLPYTLKGQGRDTANLRFIRTVPGNPPVEGKDWADVTLPVISTSSNEAFSIVSHGDDIELNYGKTGEIQIVVKYGDYELPANAPGLKYSIKDDGDKSVIITGTTATGIKVKADLASTPGSAKGYLDQIVVSYDVGADEPKSETFAFTVRIRTPLPVVTGNDPRDHSIWERGNFGQSVDFNDVPGETAIGPIGRIKIETVDEPNQYVEMWTAFGYEVVSAPNTTQNVTIPLRLTYTLKTSEGLEEFTFVFDTVFNIVGYTKPDFYVDFAPSISEGILNEKRDIRMRPIYQAQPANMGIATPRWDLVTYPAQIGPIDPATDWKRDPNNNEWWILSITGIASGVGNLVIPWEYQETAAGSPSPELLKFDVKVEARIMGEPGIEIGDRTATRIPGSHKLTGSYLLEVLFGGVPVDVPARIADGTMTMVAKPYSIADANAGAMTITANQEKTFDYVFTGPVAPGRTVDCEEKIYITYKYGGQTYTRTVEVPVEYTSGAITIPGDLTQTVQLAEMFVAKPVLIMNYMCDDFNLGTEFRTKGTITNAGVQSKYIKYNGQNYTTEWAELIDSTQTVSTTFSSTNKGYAWTVTQDVPFKLPAWDQKTYRIAINGTPATFDVFVGETKSIYVSEKWRNGGFVTPGDILNPGETDLGGLVTIDYTSKTDSFGGFGWRLFDVKGILPGSINTTLYFDRTMDLVDRPHKDPKEENYDYSLYNIILNVKVQPLTLSVATALSMGNNDVRASGAISVKLGTKTIPVNDANLKITALDPNVIELVPGSVTTTAVSYKCTLPLGTAIGTIFPARFKYEYKDPGTGLTHEGTQTVNVTYKLPDDYPVVTKLVTGGEATLWAKFGPLVRVTASGADITGQIYEWENEPTITQSELAETLLPFNGANKDWIQVIKGSGNSAYLNQGWRFKVPFRDGVASFTHRIDWHTRFVPQDPPQLTGTYKPTPVFVKKDVAGTIEFNLTYRGAKVVTPVINNALTDLKGLIRIDSLVPNTETGTITVNFTGLKEDTATMVFVWDMPNVDTPVVGKTRLNMNVNGMGGISIVLPDVPPDWDIYQTYPAPFTLMSGTTNIMGDASETVAILDPWVRRRAATSATGPTYQVTDANTVEDTVKTIEFTINFTKGSFIGQTIKVQAPVNFKKWDGLQYQVNLGLTNLPLADDGTPIISIPRTGKLDLVMTATARNPDSPTWGNPGGQITTYSALDAAQVTSYAIVTGSAGAAGGTRFTGSIAGKTNGYVKGKLAVNFLGNNTSTPNGHPAGTVGKNRQVMDVYYEVFEPELSWDKELEPAEVTLDSRTTLNNMGYVDRQLKFGRTLLGWKNITIAIRDTDKVKADVPAGGNTELVRFPLANKYINKYQDLHTTIQITATWKNGTVTYTKVWEQQILLRGAGAANPVLTLDNPHAVNGKVWDRGGLPFDVMVDGSPKGSYPPGFALKQVTISDTAYVKMYAGTGVSETWMISGGDKTKPITADPKFTVVVGDGVYTLTKEIVVRFNIEQYDGRELVVELSDVGLIKPTWWPEKLVTINHTGGIAVYFNVFFQGELVAPNTYTLLGENPASPYYSYRTVSSNTGVRGEIRTILDGNAQTRLMTNPITYMLKVYNVVSGPNGVEGVDWVWVPMPFLGYNANQMYVIDHDAEMVGKYGDKVEVNATFRQGLVEIALGGGRVLSFNPPVVSSNPATDYTPSSFLASFAAPIDVEKVVTDVTVTVGITGVDLSSSTFPLKVTQLTDVEEPTIDAPSSFDAYVSQKGKLPFTVTHDSVDITNDATNIVVTGGQYVKQTEFNVGTANVWEVIKSEVAGVTAPVKFTFDVIASGVKFSMEQTVNFAIAPFNDAALVIRPATTTTSVGIGKPGSMRFTGSWGSNKLSDNVELDLDNSELGTLIAVSGVTPNADGSLTVNYVGGSTMDEGDVTLRFKVKVGNTVPVEGYDWVDVTFQVEVMLLELVAVLPFETTGTGTQFATALLKQQVSYNGVTLDNTDPDLRISVSVGAKVGISNVYPDGVSYRFTDVITAEVIHRANVIFEYKGVARLSVPLELTQKTVEGNPTVIEIKDAEVEDGKTYGLPFKVLSGLDSRDITDTAILTGILLDSKTEYFKLNGDDTYTVIYKNPNVDVGGTARFTITVSDAGFDTELVVEVPMVILKFSGNTLKGIIVGEGVVAVNRGSSIVLKAQLERLGVKVLNTDFELDNTFALPSGWTVSAVNNDPDTFTKLLTINAPANAVSSNVNIKLKYTPLNGDTPVQNKTFILLIWRVMVTVPGQLSVLAHNNLDANVTAAIGDTVHMNYDAFLDGARLPLTDPRLTITLADYSGQGTLSKITKVGVTDRSVLLNLKTKSWNNFYTNFTFNGVLAQFMHSVGTTSDIASKVVASDYKVPSANANGELMFTVNQPVYEWHQTGNDQLPLVPAPNWTIIGAAIFDGQVVVKDKSTGTVLKTIELKGIKSDAVGRYRISIERDHKPATLEVTRAIVIDSDELQSNTTSGVTNHRSRVPLTFVKQELPGAPVLAIIDDNEVNTSVDKTTSIAFKLRQVRKSGIYQFLSTFVYESIEGPATYVASGITNPTTHEQYIQLKGTGVKGDVKIHGTITDEDGIVYPVVLNLKAQDPSQVEFVLVDTTVDGFAQSVLSVGATAEYQGSPLDLDAAGVVITAEPANWLAIDSVTADTINVKIIKDIVADETFKADIVMTAYGEVHKQELTVNASAAVPPLEISNTHVISAGNGDQGDTTLTLTFNGTNVPVNDPDVTITVPSDFEVTEQLASGFKFLITTPLGEKGPKTVRVSIKYEVTPGVFSIGEYDQQLNLIDPHDYPIVTSNSTFNLWSYLYGMTPPTLTIMSGTENVTSLGVVSDLANNDWLILPPKEEQVAGEWFWCVNGPLKDTPASKTFTYKVTVPYRDDFVTLDVQQDFYWTSGVVGVWPVLRDTWEITYAPNPVTYAAGESGEILFDVKWAGRVIKTEGALSITSPTITGLAFGSAVPAAGNKWSVSYTHTESSAVFVGDAVFTARKLDVGNVNSYITKAQTVTFKQKNTLVLEFTTPTTFAGGVGDANFGVTYTCTNNGNTFNVTQAGVTITTVPSGVIEYVNSATGKMNFKFIKKVDEVTLDKVQVFVNFEDSKSNGAELTINTSPRFVLEPLPVLGLTYKYHTNQYLPIAMTAWYGTQRVRPTSPDLTITRSSSIIGAVDDNILVAITHGKGSINSPIVITHVPTGVVKNSTLTTELSDNTSTSATALSTVTAIANEVKQLQFQVRIAATVVNIDNFSDLKLTSVPANGNAIVTQGPLQRVTESDHKLIGSNVTTGWTGTGMNISGFIASGDANYKGWWKVNNTFANIAQEEIKGTTKAKEYNPLNSSVTIQFKLEQKQGATNVPITGGTFGEIVVGGEISAVSGIAASGDVNYPYEATITPTGNVGNATLKGLVRVNGIDQHYTVLISMQTPKLTLTSSKGTTTTNPINITVGTSASIPFTVMYGDQLLMNNDPNLKWTITSNSISLAACRQYVDQTEFWVTGINQVVTGQPGSNNITVEFIDDPSKKAVLPIFFLFGTPPSSDWSTQLKTNSVPGANTDGKWVGTLSIVGGGDLPPSPTSYTQRIELINDPLPKKPVLNFPNSKLTVEDETARTGSLPMTTGWTGGDAVLQGVLKIEGNNWPIVATSITIPQQPLNPINVTNEVGDEPVEVTFGLNQVRGINGGPIVDISTIPGVTFKTVTWNSAVVQLVTTPVQGQDGTFSMTVTRKAGDKTNTLVPISMVVTVEGVDYLTIVNVKFTVPTPLVASEDTSVTVRGNKDNPVTVTQFTYLPN